MAVFVRAVFGWYRRLARVNGLPNGRGGAVVIVQRFGSALNLNVHLHAIVIDCVFAGDADSCVRFHAAPTAPPENLEALLVTIERRMHRLLARRRITDGSDAQIRPAQARPPPARRRRMVTPNERSTMPAY